MSQRTPWRARRVPPLLLAGAYLRRGVWCWAGTRALIAIAMLIAGAPPRAAVLDLALPASLGALAIASTLGYLDLLRRGERVWLANLGVSLPAVLPFFLVPAVLGELTIHLLARGM